MRVAAIDVGTNSIHLLAADIAADGRVTPVDSQRVQVMLGSGGLGHHRIAPDAFERGVDALRTLRAAIDSLGVEEIHASATSAVREAENGPDFCRAVKDATGIHLRVVSGADEARLIWLGVRPALDFTRGPALVFDVGGGSTEFILGDGAGIQHLCSLHLGHIRLAERFHRSDPIKDDDLAALRKHIRSELAPLVARVGPSTSGAAPFGTLIGTSGTARTLARMASAARTRALPDHDEGLVLTRKDLERLLEQLRERPRARFDELPAMDSKRRDTLLAGAVLVREIMRSLGATQLTTSERSLREGLLADWILRHRPELELERVVTQPRERAVLATMQRFGVDEAHARQTARLATLIFDGTARLHNLGAADRELLRDAALLHDIGHHVSGENHPKHGQYLLKNIRLYGFLAPEVAILANLVRYHSRTRPKRKHSDFGALSRTDQRRVRVLAGMLQIADGLDRSHNQPVRDLEIDTHSGRVLLRALTTVDGELERWEVHQRRPLLAEALGVPVEIEVVGAQGPVNADAAPTWSSDAIADA
jgi:exopolyphosphatase/guanosine-5'-triphosphate,3'-diphosphate pyrophosphatase